MSTDTDSQSCYICNKKCIEKIAYCSCDKVKLHPQCLNREYTAGRLKNCPSCYASYNVAQTTTYVCTLSNCNYFLYGIYVILSTLLFSFLLVPFDLLNGVGVQSRIVQNSFSYNDSSWLLFPGNPLRDLTIMDGFYCVVTGSLIFTLIFVPVTYHWSNGSQYREIGTGFNLIFKKMKESVVVSLFVPLVPSLILLFLHFCGNIHYQFYCYVGAIPAQNCFWTMKWTTLVASIAGMILLAVFELVVGIIIWALTKAFIKKEESTVILPITTKS